MAPAGKMIPLAAVLVAGTVWLSAGGCGDPAAQGILVEDIALLDEASEPGSPVPSRPPSPAPPRSATKTGLVAYYPFDGDARDASGRGNHGQIRKKVRFVPGVVGKAARFGGVDAPGCVYVKNSESLKFKRAFTIACYVQILDPAGKDGYGRRADKAHQVFVAKYADPSGWVLYAHYNGWKIPTTGLTGNGRGAKWAGARVPTTKHLKRWMHLASVSDADGLRTYHDGKLVKSTSIPVDFAQANRHPMWIGRQGNTFPFHLNGMIDELRIYNRSLSQGEIQGLMRSR
ncbi:hypothetical protein LCGC14_1275570 [marine sediment metagenome]|uniref:LamG-like jellyroll fold domain-containing protein n=1 Tax=marine sediment metagenome TaxID=412755 RepID=A0A0F9KWU1_9ZZZZ